MISDVDEVCTIESIQNAIDNYDEKMIALGSNQEMFWYSFKTKEPNYWSGSILTKVKFALEYSPEFFRVKRWVLPKVLLGYHMTYFMDIEKMKYKIENFAHQELNKDEFTNPEKIQERIKHSKGRHRRIHANTFLTMKLTNTYISKDCTRKALMYTDKNGHYIIKRYFLWESVGWAFQNIGRQKFKHFHTAERAVKKFIN
jgi:hypothetical protein